MLLVCAQFQLAERIGALLPTEPAYAFSLDAAIEEAGARQPTIVFLDARLGRSNQRAVEWIPLLLHQSPTSAVIIVTHAATLEEISEAVELGAYHYLNRLDDAFALKLRRVISGAVASAESRVGRMERSRFLSRRRRH